MGFEYHQAVFQTLDGRPLGGLFVGLDVGRGRRYALLGAQNTFKNSCRNHHINQKKKDEVILILLVRARYIINGTNYYVLIINKKCTGRTRDWCI